MLREFWSLSLSFVLAVMVHLLVAAIVVLGTMDWRPFKPPVLSGMTIEAVMVDTEKLKARRDQARREAAEALQLKAQQERREQELTERRERLAREKREADEAERQRLKQQVETKRQEDLRLQRMREQQERDRQERLARQQAELEELRRKREAAAREAQLQEEKMKQLEARREAEAAAQRQVRDEAALQRLMAQEQSERRAGEMASLAGQYYAAIQTQVTNNWLRPPTARTGLKCTLRIIQIPGGEIISATIAGSCNADEATRRSLVAAVERAGSLPYRGFEDVFEREIDFIFRYDGD